MVSNCRVYLSRIILILLICFIAACSSQLSTSTQPNTTLPITDSADLNIVTGQVVFVPAYSQVTFPVNGSTNRLAVTLAIHNTDLEHPIVIQSVRYYDTEGSLVREFVESPAILNAMATTGFVVDGREADVGWGANFVVEWVAEQPVYEPVIEALMYSDGGLEGYSFISTGRIISEQMP